MKSKHTWKPTKYKYIDNRIIPSADPNELSPASRLIAQLVADRYSVLLPRYAHGRLLDLGCGRVPFYMLYEHLVTETVCIDWQENEHVDLACDLNNPLPFPDNHFDTIICSDVLEHIFRPIGLFLEIQRILNKHGKIIMNVPFIYWIHEPPHDYYRYTQFSLRNFIEEANLDLIDLQAIGGAPEIVADIFAKNAYVHVPVFGRTLAVIVQRLTYLFQKTRLGRKVSEATSEQFPLGYFLVAEKSKA